MFFYSKWGERMQHAVVRCFRFKGTTKAHIIDSKTFSGTLLSQYEQTTLWLKEKLNVEYIMRGTDPRQEKWEIPLEAIKECLTNAICHRDYYETGATILVELYDDRLEISNPGGLLPAVEQNFGHKSLSRNPKVFELFMRLDLVEKVGSGIHRIAEEMKAANLPAPNYNSDGFFTVVLYKSPSLSSLSKEKGKEKGKEKSIQSTAMDKILQLIIDNPSITTTELAVACKVSEHAIYKTIRKLRENGIIERSGGRKSGIWTVRENE